MNTTRRIRLERIPTPAASRRTHLLAGALFWSVVGLGLSAAGCTWIVRSGGGVLPLIVVPAALAAGWLKARLVLYRAADRVVRRIEARGDDRCIGGFFSWKSWLLVLCMIILGRLLRASPLPLVWRGAIYLAIGAALFLSSLRIWAARRKSSDPSAEAKGSYRS
jgi:hypothetical protein